MENQSGTPFGMIKLGWRYHINEKMYTCTSVQGVIILRANRTDTVPDTIFISPGIAPIGSNEWSNPPKSY